MLCGEVNIMPLDIEDAKGKKFYPDERDYIVEVNPNRIKCKVCGIYKEIHNMNHEFEQIQKTETNENENV